MKVGRRQAAFLMVVGVCLSLAAVLIMRVRAEEPPAGVVSSKSHWGHTLQVVADLRERPPKSPVVLLLGGSAAREAVVSDKVWGSQVRRSTGSEIACYDLATNVQSYADDTNLIRALPPGGRFLVFIGVNPGRYCQPPATPTVPLPQPGRSVPPDPQHRYDDRRLKTAATKRALAKEWLNEHYALFRRWQSYNSEQLDRLVKTCVSRGFRPVLLDLPCEPTWAESVLAVPLKDCRVDGRSVAASCSVPWVSLNSDARLTTGDFYDLWHIVGGAGRSRWQRLLSQVTSRQLEAAGWTSVEVRSSVAP